MLNKIKSSYWLRSGSYSLMTRISFAVFGIINFYFLVRVLSIDEFGEWTLFLTVAAVTESVRNAFIYNPLIKFFNSSEKNDHKKILSASLFLNVLTALIVILLLVILASTLHLFWDAPTLPYILLIYSIGALSFSFFTHFNLVEQAHLDFKGTFYSSFVQKFLFFAYIVFKYYSDKGFGLIELTWAYVASYVIAAALSYLTARHLNQFSFKIDFNWVKTLFHYGKYTFGTNASNMINKNVRDWLLGGMLNKEAVAIFNPAVRITQFLEIPLMAAASVFYPAVVKKAKEEGNKGAKYMYERSVGIILIAITPLVFIIFFFAEEIITFMAGDKYLESIPLLKITIFYGLFVPFQRQFGITLNAIGLARINFQFIISSSVFGILINYFAILYYGLEGAAYGTLFSMAASVVVVQFVLKKHINVSYLNIAKYAFQAIPEGIGLMKRLLSKS